MTFKKKKKKCMHDLNSVIYDSLCSTDVDECKSCYMIYLLMMMASNHMTKIDVSNLYND